MRAAWAACRFQLGPLKHLLAPGIQEPEGQDDNENQHLDQTEDAVGLESCRPRKHEDRFDVEHDEEEGIEVIADLALRPAAADRLQPGFVDQILPFPRARWAEGLVEDWKTGALGQ